MRRLVQVNVTAASGSHGMIAEEIGLLAMSQGWQSWIVYGRWCGQSKSQLIRIGSDWDIRSHGVQSRLFDNHGLASHYATRRFVRRLEEIKPDIVHLHNIHGYYLNYPQLFDYLRYSGVPVIWTLHDCWSFTGHCAYYTAAKCERWKTHCFGCPEKRSYPASFFLDRSRRNYELKREVFTGLPNLTLVPVSQWLANDLNESFLCQYPTHMIHNGIDLSVFRPHGSPKEKKFLLGVASVWERRKGLNEFFKLREQLPPDYRISLVGLSPKQISELPDGIEGISRTNSREELAKLYSRASVFVNPTFEDNFPTVNLEALACGTPVVTYRTGGSPEAIDSLTGIVVEPGEISELVSAIYNAEQLSPTDCRHRAQMLFDKNICFNKYLDLYNEILSK